MAISGVLSVFGRRKTADVSSSKSRSSSTRAPSRTGTSGYTPSVSSKVPSSYRPYGSAYDVSGLRREPVRKTSLSRDGGSAGYGGYYTSGSTTTSSSSSLYGTGRRPSYDTGTTTSSMSNLSISSGSKSSSGKLCCDKCDGKHATEACPYFKKAREQHPDALRRKPVDLGGGGGNFVLRSARVVRQPGDGSCLFHSMSYGLGGTSASALRREIAAFIERNEDLEIAGDPLRDWVKWDSGCSAQRYARRMSVSGWGGGIEMAACARLKGVNIHVYERGIAGFKRISCFDVPGARKTIHVLYCGGVHYDALVPV